MIGKNQLLLKEERNGREQGSQVQMFAEKRMKFGFLWFLVRFLDKKHYKKNIKLDCF